MADQRTREASGRSAAVLPFPGVPDFPQLSSLVPTARSLVLGLLLVLAGIGAYLGARETSVFAIRQVDVRGTSPAVAAEVQAALAPLTGRSLVGLDGKEVERRVTALADVVSARYDRAFPNTLRVVVRAERPVAVLRQGSSSWLVSTRSRVIRVLEPHGAPALPRVWLPSGVSVSVGGTLADAQAAQGVRALAPLAGSRFLARVGFVRSQHGGLVLVLRSGIEIILGEPTDLALKAAVARRVLQLVEGGSTPVRYVDVSLPDRPVTGTMKPQVEG